jgi:hypothetical protein
MYYAYLLLFQGLAIGEVQISPEQGVRFRPKNFGYAGMNPKLMQEIHITTNGGGMIKTAVAEYNLTWVLGEIGAKICTVYQLFIRH